MSSELETRATKWSTINLKTMFSMFVFETLFASTFLPIDILDSASNFWLSSWSRSTLFAEHCQSSLSHATRGPPLCLLQGNHHNCRPIHSLLPIEVLFYVTWLLIAIADSGVWQTPRWLLYTLCTPSFDYCSVSYFRIRFIIDSLVACDSDSRRIFLFMIGRS